MLLQKLHNPMLPFLDVDVSNATKDLFMSLKTIMTKQYHLLFFSLELPEQLIYFTHYTAFIFPHEQSPMICESAGNAQVIIYMCQCIFIEYPLLQFFTPLYGLCLARCLSVFIINQKIMTVCILRYWVH